MSMSKKEKEHVASLELSLRLERSFRRTEPVSRDAEATGDDLVIGWDFNLLSPRVYTAWTTKNSNGMGHVRSGGYQGHQPLYSTHLLALKALRYALEQRACADLMKIDDMIGKI